MNNYIDIFEKTPLIGLWGKFTIKDNKEVFEIQGFNEMASKNFNNIIVGQDILDTFNIKYRSCISLLYKKIQEEKEYSIDEYIPYLNKFYSLDIINIYDDFYVIWLTKEYSYDKYTKEILNNLDILTWVKDKEGRYVVTNLYFENYGNIISEDMIGKTDFELFPKGVAIGFNESDKKIMNKEVDRISTLTFVNDKYYNGVLLPVYDEGKNIVGTMGICKDMTDVQESKLDVSTRDKMLEIISDNIPDNIFFKDSKGIFRYANESFLNQYGYKKEDLIGKSELDLKGVKDYYSEIHLKEEKEVFETRKKIINEHVTILENGKKIYVETVKVPFIDNNGMLGGILGISRDISHRKEAEMEYERLMMEFFSNLSHEFRTPLNLIFSAIQILNLNFAKCNNCNNIQCSNSGYNRYLNIIKQNSFRLLKLVNNLIDTTRLDAGSLEYKPTNCNIVSYIENIFDSVIELANQHSINMIFDTNKEEQIVSFDLDKMERIILNLISNAIKFNKKGGTIEVSLECSDEYIEIIVKDSGIGIPKDKLAEIFDKFKQANNRMTKVNEGSGIGLSLVKSLVELHEGEVSVESEVGKYSKFNVKIPNKILENEIVIKEEQFSYKNIENINVEFSDIYDLNT